MYVSTKRLPGLVTSVMRRIVLLNLGLAVVLIAHAVQGQDQGELGMVQPQGEPVAGQGAAMYPQGPRTFQSSLGNAQSEFGDAVQDGLLFGEELSGRNGEAFGALMRAGVLTGPSIGRTQTLVPLEAMPYAFNNNAMVFGDFRGFRGTDSGWGFNAGGGIRYYAERWDRILGANVFYDYDNSSGAMFRQVGFGIESLGQWFDARANAYIPHGSTQQLLSTQLIAGSQRFSGHNLLYDDQLTFGNALRGVDLEIGVPLPGRVARQHDAKVFGGWYYYSGTSVPGFSGWKARAQANLIQSLNLQVEVFSDQVFNTNVVFGATWTYGGYRQPEEQKRTQFDRMTEMVRRNYNVIVARTPVLEKGLVAINPLNNQPYFFEHVASYAPVPGADGTIDHPWRTISQAQTAMNAILPTPELRAGNIIYVHANSVYNTAPDNTVTLIPGVRILGEGNGVVHVVKVSNLGNIPIPRATTFANKPIFENQTGDAVTLVSGLANAPSEFSGFTIGDPTDPTTGPAGNGIFGNLISNVVINQDDINNAQGDGILLTNTTGNVAILGTTINNIGHVQDGSVGLNIEGGTGRITFGLEPFSQKASVINNAFAVNTVDIGGVTTNIPTGGPALLINATSTGSVVDLTGSTINDGRLATTTVPGLQGGGIILNNIDGNVNIGTLNLVNTVVVAPITNLDAGPLANAPSGAAIDIEGTPVPNPQTTPATPPKGLGQIGFVGGIAIDNPVGDAIHINGIQGDTPGTGNRVGNVRFLLPSPTQGILAPGIRITNRNAGGINVINDVFGNVSFLEPVSISGNGTGAAINYQNNSGNLVFQSLLPSSSPFEIQISGGLGNGIQIGGFTRNANPNDFTPVAFQSNTGSFTVIGTTNIQNVAGTSIQVGVPNFILPQLPLTPGGPQTAQTADLWGVTQGATVAGVQTGGLNGFFSANQGAVTFGTVSIDNRGGRGISVMEVDHPVKFTGTVTVGNTNNSLFSAVDIEGNFISSNLPAGATTATNSSGQVVFTTLDILAAQGSVTAPITSGAGLNVIENPSSVSIQLLNINQNSLVGNGVALFAQDVGLVDRVAVAAGQLETPPVFNSPSIIPSITSASKFPTLGLSIGGGNIFSNGGAAVVISDAVMGITLTSVNSNISSTEGINLQNNIGAASEVQTNGITIHPAIFTVTGVGNALGSGGTIQGSTNEGIFLANTETVQLKDMNITGNNMSGVYAQTPELIMINDQVTGNAWYGINFDAYAVPRTTANRNLPSINPELILQGSTVTGNQALAEVLFTAEAQGTYTFLLGKSGGLPNTITHTTLLAPNTPAAPEGRAPVPVNDAGVMIQTAQAGIGSTINLVAVNNVFNVQQGVGLAVPLADFQMNWNGPVATGTIEANTFNFGVDSGEGILINLPSNSAVSNFRIAGNTFNSPAGIGTTGIDITTATTTGTTTGTTTSGGASNIQIGALDGLGGNLMNFIEPAIGGAGGGGLRIDDEGMRFNLGANSTVNIFTNQITMTGTNLEAIQFTSITGPSVIALNNNLITETGGLANLYGIRILTVTSGTARLFGSLDNIIDINGQTGSTFPWWFSPGPAIGNTPGTAGSTIINGVNVQ